MVLDRLWWPLVRFGFRLLYNELAFTYDAVSRIVSLGQWRTWQRAAFHYLDLSPGAAVLELAFGTGDLQLDLHAAGVWAAGLDRSRAMQRLAARKLHRQGLSPRLVLGDATALPFAAGSFLAVVSTFPTPFIVEPRALAEISRVLRPGGRLVIVASGRLTGAGPLVRLLEFAYTVTGQRGPWPVEDFMARFRAAGLPAEKVTHPVPGGEVTLVVARKPAV